MNLQSLTSEDILRQDAWLRRAARALVRDPALAEDLAQDTWVTALQNERGGESDRPWMMGVAFRTLQARFRRDRNARGREQDVASVPEAPSTAEVVEQIDLRRRVATELLGLDEPYRTALHLHFVVGDSFRMIAKKTNVSVSTAKARCDRGIVRLRQALEAGADADRRSWLRALAVAAMPPAAGVKLGAKATAAAAVALLGGAAWFGTQALSDRVGPAASGQEAALPQPQRVDGALEADPGGALGLASVEDLPGAESGRRKDARPVAVASDEDAKGAAQSEQQTSGSGDVVKVRAALRLPGGAPASGTWILLGWPGTDNGLTREEVKSSSFTKKGSVKPSGQLEVSFERHSRLQYVLEVTASSGVARSWRWSDDELEGAMDLGEVIFASTAELTGRLTDAVGGPPPASDRWMIGASWAVPGADLETGRAGPVLVDPVSGSFTFPAVPVGMIELRVRGVSAGSLTARPVMVTPGRNDPIEITLPAVVAETRVQLAESRKHVQMGALGLDEEKLLLVDQAGRRWPASPVPRRPAQYSFPGAPPGPGTIILEDPRYLPLRKESVAPGSAVTLRVTGSASIRPRVVDADGKEIDSFRLEAMKVTEPQGSRARTVLLAEGDQLAEGVKTGLTPGRYRFFARAQDARGEVDVPDLQPNEEQSIEIVLHTSPKVRGSITRPDGAPAAAIQVRLVEPAVIGDGSATRILSGSTSTSSPERFRWLAASMRSGDDGTFEFSPPGEGRYLVLVGEPSGSSIETEPFEIRHGGDPVVLDLVLAAGGYIEGVVRVPGVTSPRGWTLTAGQPRAFSGHSGQHNPAAATLGASGDVRLGPLPAGPIDLYLLEPGMLSGSALFRSSRRGADPLASVTVIDGETVTADLDVPTAPIATVRPKVLDPASLGPWFRVTLIPVDAEFWQPTFNAMARGGTLPPIYAQPGEYRVCVTSDSWAWVRQETLGLAVGDQLDLELDVRLERRELRVVLADGSPVTEPLTGQPGPGGAHWGDHARFRLRPAEDGSLTATLGPGTYTIATLGDRQKITIQWPPPAGQTELVLE